MIVVELQDFEKYRKKLWRYALGLLRTRGSGNELFEELDEKAKDIVQDCYLRFHNHYQDAFVTENHLFNFLKLCLYRSYMESKNPKNRLQQYNILKDAETTSNLSEDRIPSSHIVEIKDRDLVEKFIDTLNSNQRNIVEQLLEGYSSVEIAEQKGVTKQAINSALNFIRKRLLKYEGKSN